ncbi:MAG TPA: RidA family protein [Syntrophales bacterium]|nr:RidA family protein [Syntrophales bacterium]
MSTVSERKIISTPHAPKAIGPYAQAVQYGDLLFVSGMIPLDPKTGELLTGNFEAEIVLVLENIKAVVEASGMSLKNVLKSTVFLKDLGNFGKFNEIYGRYFGDILPARETVQAAQLPRDVSIEISVICGK